MVKPTCIHQGVVGECDICKAEDLLDGKITTMKISAEEDNRHLKSIIKFGIIGSIVGFIFTAAVVYMFWGHLNKDTQIAQAHVKTVMTIDRNCNECHLGESFINLFNHPAVKANDNVVNKMMDNAKIKRW